MKSENDFSLVKPLISFPPYPDENPIGYLIRLAYANRYGSLHWMILSNNGRAIYMNYLNTYRLIEHTPWSQGHLNEDVKAITALPTKLLNRSELKFCASCLKEAKYYRISWQLRSSLVCLRHQKYFQDRCKECFSEISLHKGTIGYCSCRNDLRVESHNITDKSAIDLQLFIEGKSFLSSEAFLGKDLSQLSLQERNEFVIKLSEWQLEAIIYKDKNWQKKVLTMGALKFVAKTFFSHKQLFLDYLLALSQLEINKLPDDIDNVFVNFYRFFYRNFKNDIFVTYKQWIEEFILEKWDKPISHRNSLFSKALVKNYPWITIEKASKIKRVVPSDLYKAIEDGQLLSVSFQKSQNVYTLVYRPNLFVLEEYLTQIASFTRTQAILKITKKQLYELLENQFFPEAVSPQKNNRGVWVIPKDKVLSLIEEFHLIKDHNSLAGITIGQAMRIICGRIPVAFVTLLTAIRNKDVKIFYNPSWDVLRRREKDSLQSFTICRDSLGNWIAKQIKMPGYFTIPEFAVYWDIHQEFAYQLVNMGVIGYEIKGRTRYITDFHMDEFESKYTILTHFSREKGQTVKRLVALLESLGENPIDIDWDVKLRQKVYRKEILELLL